MLSEIRVEPTRLKWLGFKHLLICLFAYLPLAEAHVGSSGVIVQKQAGKYQVLISIQPPDVVPGTASIRVFVEQGRISAIGARPVYFDAGDKGAPTHDTLRRTRDGQYEGDVWLMASGSSSIELTINGPDGRQPVIVPIMAQATALREMPKGTGFGLALMGILLIIMLVTIIGASNADALVLPGRLIPVTLQHRRREGMTIGLVLITLLLTGWRFWWNERATDYKDVQLYQPTPIHASAQIQHAQRHLTIQFTTASFGQNRRNQRTISYLIPDHGKLMHTFLVRMPGLDAFAHLHPDRRDTLHYDAVLPSLPGGKYLLYTDIVYRNGFTETLTDTVNVPTLKISAEAAVRVKPSDPDDSWLITEPMGVKANAIDIPHLDNDMVVCGKPSVSTKLIDSESTAPAKVRLSDRLGEFPLSKPNASGLMMYWMDKAAPILEAGKVYTLKFAVADSTGKPAPLEPYMGMSGHAVVMRSDGTVYIHLHPVGTYSMAAEGSLVNRIADTTRTFHYPKAAYFRDSIDRYLATLKALPEDQRNQLLMETPGMNHPMKTNNMVEFPYAFPRAGHYRIWVQVKREGRILTGVFDAQVNDQVL